MAGTQKALSATNEDLNFYSELRVERGGTRKY